MKCVYNLVNKFITNYNKIYNNIFFYISFLLIIIVFFWFIKGFYIIKKNEKATILRFGKYYNIKNSGINWIIYGIDNVKIINTKNINNINSLNLIFTKDENLIYIKTNIKYSIIDLKKYLININNIKFNINNIIDSIILENSNKFSFNELLDNNKKKILKEIFLKNINLKINELDIGINIIEVDIKKIYPPEEIKKYIYNNTLLIEKFKLENKKKIEEYNNYIKYKFNIYSIIINNKIKSL
ncbi:SPFH domain-containing protein [endosymbiont of Euscepes postfasciatus]|uniref:SPFH domain-containing protein n=1 Tax=endosymbiont of Euscepes postfasciatus TaxID=650377 RepID=UPI001558A930|nr:SPFH domain-containing protein [endosymbiont of Euscepes postfasciatus]